MALLTMTIVIADDTSDSGLGKIVYTISMIDGEVLGGTLVNYYWS